MKAVSSSASSDCDGRRVREFYHIDDNLLPVVEWDSYGSKLSFVTETVAKWMEKHKSTKLVGLYKEYYKAKARNDENVKEPGNDAYDDEDEDDAAKSDGRRQQDNQSTAADKDAKDGIDMEDDIDSKRNNKNFIPLEPILTYCNMELGCISLELTIRDDHDQDKVEY